MRIKFISAITALLMSATVLGAALTADGTSVGKRPSGSGSSSVSDILDGSTGSTTLNVVKYGDKLTQEQVASKIKAEYLKENGGYKDTDEVVVMIAVEGDSLIDTYNGGETNAKTVAEYGETFSGKVQAAQNTAKQNEVVTLLKSKGLIESVEYNYTMVLNAVAVKTVYGNLEKIEKTAGVKSVALSDTYNQITVQSSDASNVPLNNVDIDENTGIYNNTSDYTGLGTVTAVLDSGFDMSHRVFERNYTDEQRQKLVIVKNGTKLNVKSGTLNYGTDTTYIDSDGNIDLSKFNAGQTTKNLQVKDIWYSDKIPFAYDYADKNPDVFPYDSEHGTHVAGIIAGEDDIIKGIAPDTQLVLMKVFPDLDSGGKTEDIIAALEDAVRLNVDAINMSLGTSCGFSRECDDDPDKPNVAKVYDAINDSGISLITAASNSYSSGFGGDQGNTNFVTNPDSGTVGSPSTYDAALSVASISGEKSRYIKTSGNKMFFYSESSDLQKVDLNDFFNELVSAGTVKNDGKDHEFQLVVVPGVGAEESYAGFRTKYESSHPGENVKDENVKKKILAGKIVLVERGSNSFEDKARIAASYGAVACIIYNNIDGTISMSMGSRAHIPTISISKDDGKMLLEEAKSYDNGETTIFINSDYLAGPFMSDFSSWGPTPSLGIKPEITAHGGNIMSAVPGRDGDEYRYDKLSGTSMACPNLCGIVVLIRQYLKDNYGGELDSRQIKNLTNQLMMSTAGIAINEENNPYSPRKQGAGLADIGRTTTTKGYITVDGSDRTKLELGDDPRRTGVYEMNFNVVNMGSADLAYSLSITGMTESVSASDDKHVAETPYILSNNNVKVEFISGNGSVEGNRIVVKGNAAGTKASEWNKVSVKVTYTLNDDDKRYLEAHFENGMYVEGFVNLANETGDVNLNAPFLAFYGDWTEAPMFDKTYYEVESTAHDPEIDDDDKIKADYYATTPYGQYFYNYMIPLGTYLYDVDETKYSKMPASEDKIAISDTLGAIDGISVVLAGLLRGAKTMTFTITDKATGEELWSHIDYNALKASSQGGSPLPYYDYLKLNSADLGLVNNRVYEFKMQGTLDYGDDGGLSTNKRNSYTFDFTLDNEAPVIKNVEYRKEYDSSDEKYHYYMDMTVYDNQYAMSITPIIFTSSSSYTFLTKNPIPITNAVKGGDVTVSFEITDYLDDIFSDAIIPNALAFSVDDYALNSNIYLCQFPGTRGDFKFTRTGEKDSSELLILPVVEGQTVDLTQYLYTADATIGENRENAEYLKHLVWTSSNTDYIEVEQGLLKVKKAGRATVTVTEKWEGKQAVIIINAKPSGEEQTVAAALQRAGVSAPSYQNDIIEEMRFTSFKTVFAYSKAAQTSEIGSTGDVNYVHATSGTVSMYPGEEITLYNQVKPWYVADKYDYKYVSGNPDFVTVDGNGKVTAVKEGVSSITLQAVDKTTGRESPIVATISINVKSPFVIENRTLVAYKGTGDENGVVEIPDDEGVLYIGSFAFCLYTTDRNVILDEDYDANKIPSSNDSITKVIIPEGVEEIQKYAFYSCTKLKEVVLPSTVKYIREFAFALNTELSKIGENDGNGNAIEGRLNREAIVIGAQAFRKCAKLGQIDLTNIYAIGERAFEGCSSLAEVNLKNLRNSGINIFQNCTALKTVAMNEHTKLSQAMFVNSGLEEVEIYETTELPAYIFANCYELKKVTINKSLLSVGIGAFSRCISLTEFNYANGVTIGKFGEQAFYNATGLTTFNLPEGETALGNYCFYMDETDSTLKSKYPQNVENKFTTLVFGEKTKLSDVDGAVFRGCKLAEFKVHANNPYYATSADNKLLTSKDGKIVYLAATGADYGTYTIGENVEEIASGAFSGAKISKLVIENPDCKIGDYAFAHCEGLTEVILPENNNVTIGAYSFVYAGTETGADGKIKGLTIENLDSVKEIGAYAFRNAGIKNVVVTLKGGATLGEGAFYDSYLESAEINIGEGGGKLGLGVFNTCGALVSVKFNKLDGAENERIALGNAMFANSKNLVEIELNHVTETIPIQAFYGCTKLQTAKLYGVKTIENGAFANCSALSAVLFTEVDEKGNVTGTDTLETIGDGAFAGYNITNAPVFTAIRLPETLEKIGEGAFLGCSGLLKITIPDGVSFPSDKDTEEGDAETVMHFNGNYVFYGCTSLEEVTLGGSVTKIGKYMFAQCNSLRTINLGEVTYIGDYAFTQPLQANRDDVSVLNNLDLSKAEYIGEAAFMNCTALSGTIIASSVTEVGAYAFMNTNLEDFRALKLEKIGGSAFNSIINKKFTEFIVTENLKSVGEAAFYGSTYLKRFTTKDGKTGFGKAVDLGNALLYEGSLYVKLKNGNWQLSAVPANLCDDDGERYDVLNVYDGTTRIDAFAGNQNDKIEDIILPESLEYIGNYAFYGYRGRNVELTVHFSSYSAPVLENSYNKNLTLDEKAIGYGLLHAYPDLFQTELCYCNFVGLVGSVDRIQMMLPSNENLEGYDSLVYEAYFGSVDEAYRSGKIVMDKYTSEFLNSARLIEGKLGSLALSDEKQVINAITAMNATKQKDDCDKFGVDINEWETLEGVLAEAKEEIRKLKLAESSDKVKNIEDEILALPDKFGIENLEQFRKLTEEIDDLTADEKTVLSVAKFEEFRASFNEYLNKIEEEADELSGVTGFKFAEKQSNASANVSDATAAGTLLGLLAIVLKKRFF